MNGYIDLGDGQIQLPFGVLSGVASLEKEGGALKAVSLCEKNVIVTHIGDLYAAYTETPRRKRKPSVEFYANGLAKAVALEEQQEVITPIGELPAELVTFYETGELHRVFPVDGQIGGFWSEEDERGMNVPLTFNLGFAVFTAMLNSLCFYQSGAIRSVALYPGETIMVDTPLGRLTVRHGFSLYETGELQSFEPAFPVGVATPIGRITAYDSLSHGVHADENSVSLSPDGKLTGVKTIANRILAQPAGEAVRWHTPVSIPHPCSDELPCFKPLEIRFGPDTVTVTDEREYVYSLADCHFGVSPFSDGSLGCSPADCANCSLCGH